MDNNDMDESDLDAKLHSMYNDTDEDECKFDSMDTGDDSMILSLDSLVWYYH